MIYICAYIILGISTGIIMQANWPVRVACVFTWPLYWFAFLFAHVVGWMPAKCAWCGESVAGHADKDKWRAHYLDECQAHPLAVKCKRLENYMDELDAKCTHYRVKCDVLEAQIYGETKS